MSCTHTVYNRFQRLMHIINVEWHFIQPLARTETVMVCAGIVIGEPDGPFWVEG